MSRNNKNKAGILVLPMNKYTTNDYLWNVFFKPKLNRIWLFRVKHSTIQTTKSTRILSFPTGHCTVKVDILRYYLWLNSTALKQYNQN